MEISGRNVGAVDAIRTLGLQCKAIRNHLPTFISPWIDGKKALMAAALALTKAAGIEVAQHEKEWNEIFSGI